MITLLAPQNLYRNKYLNVTKMLIWKWNYICISVRLLLCKTWDQLLTVRCLLSEHPLCFLWARNCADGAAFSISFFFVLFFFRNMFLFSSLPFKLLLTLIGCQKMYSLINQSKSPSELTCPISLPKQKISNHFKIHSNWPLLCDAAAQLIFIQS